MMNNIYKQIPTGWALCFIGSCPLKDKCLRYKAGLSIPSDLYAIRSVTSAAASINPCPMFRPIETMRVALGFGRIFADVKARHAPEMHAKLEAYLGGNGTYYRYMHGELGLTPEQQEWMRGLFRSYGYSDDVVYDAFEERYRFYDE